MILLDGCLLKRIFATSAAWELHLVCFNSKGLSLDLTVNIKRIN